MLEQEGKYVHRIWRALDAEATFFGIRGRYIMLFAVIAAGGCIPCLCIQSAVGSLPGTISFITMVALDYFYIMTVQSRLTVRQFSRMMARRQLRRYSRVRPISVAEYLKGEKK